MDCLDRHTYPRNGRPTSLVGRSLAPPNDVRTIGLNTVPPRVTVEQFRALGLTARESQVVLTLTEGMGAKGAARQLRISVPTVHKHLEHVFRKLGVHNQLSVLMMVVDAVMRSPSLGGDPLLEHGAGTGGPSIAPASVEAPGSRV